MDARPVWAAYERLSLQTRLASKSNNLVSNSQVLRLQAWIIMHSFAKLQGFLHFTAGLPHVQENMWNSQDNSEEMVQFMCVYWVLTTERRYSLQPIKITILFVCCEQMRISNTSGWPQTYHVAEDNIKLRILQCFHFPSFMITGMCYLALLSSNWWKVYKLGRLFRGRALS